MIYRKVRELRVESATRLHVNADGEPLEGTRFDYSLVPHRIELVVPEPLAVAGEAEGE